MSHLGDGTSAGKSFRRGARTSSFLTPASSALVKIVLCVCVCVCVCVRARACVCKEDRLADMPGRFWLASYSSQADAPPSQTRRRLSHIHTQTTEEEGTGVVLVLLGALGVKELALGARALALDVSGILSFIFPSRFPLAPAHATHVSRGQASRLPCRALRRLHPGVRQTQASRSRAASIPVCGRRRQADLGLHLALALAPRPKSNSTSALTSTNTSSVLHTPVALLCV